jgi:hypothetical protein
MDFTDYGLDKTYPTEQPQIAGMANALQRKPNLTERLEIQIKDLETRLARLKEAHAELKKNPGIEHLLNLLQRI